MTCKKLGTSGFLCTNIGGFDYSRENACRDAHRAKTQALIDRNKELQGENDALRAELARLKEARVAAETVASVLQERERG